MKNPQIPIAREGYPFIAFAFLVCIVIALLGYDLLALASLVLAGIVLFFFRDPERVSPDEDDVVVAPADGKVILIEKVFDDQYVNEHVYKVSIFMNVFNVHVNRIPFPGKVKKIDYSPGKFYAANTELGAMHNEKCGVVITTPSQRSFAVVQVAGMLACRIVCWAEKGDEVRRGERFGLIRFGSRVDLYLPQQLQMEVSVGQRVKAGETILGYLPQ